MPPKSHKTPPISVYDHGYFDGHGDGERRMRKTIVSLLSNPTEEMLRELASAAAHSIGKRSSIQDVARVAAVLKALVGIIPQED